MNARGQNRSSGPEFNQYTAGMPLGQGKAPPDEYRLSSDGGVGEFQPADVRVAEFIRVAPERLEALRKLDGFSSTASDVLDELGWRLGVPASTLPRRSGSHCVVGHAVTLRYLPERTHLGHRGSAEVSPKLAHHVAIRMSQPGDALVIDAAGCGEISVMGGIAASSAVRAGIGGVVVDGAVRDVAELRSCGLPVWSRYVTPITGKERLEAASINAPIQCGGVQVCPGDLVLADDSGICFIPTAIAGEVLERIVQVLSEDRHHQQGRKHEQ